MRVVNIIRDIAGTVLLACAWVLVLYAYGAYGGQEWLAELLGNVIVICYLGMIPLSILHSLLAILAGSDWEKRLTRSMVMKLLLVPFFVVNFWMGVAGAAAFFLGGLLLTGLALVIAWLALLATSVDVIRALILMRQEGRLTTGLVIGHIVFQFIYCADVIDTIILWLNRERYISQPGA